MFISSPLWLLIWPLRFWLWAVKFCYHLIDINLPNLFGRWGFDNLYFILFFLAKSLAIVLTAINRIEYFTLSQMMLIEFIKLTRLSVILFKFTFHFSYVQSSPHDTNVSCVSDHLWHFKSMYNVGNLIQCYMHIVCVSVMSSVWERYDLVIHPKK